MSRFCSFDSRHVPLEMLDIRKFYLTCVVGLQTHEDIQFDHSLIKCDQSMVKTVKDTRKMLESAIAVRRVEVNF